MDSLCYAVRPSVVHTHGYRPDVVDGAVARGLGIPTVSTVHGFTRSRGRGQLYEWMQRRALRRFDAVVCVSRAQVAELERAGVPTQRLHLIPNAWSGRVNPLPASVARARLNVAPDAFHVGFVGRLSQEKGPDVLMDALAQLVDVPIVASFVGAGKLKKRLAARALRGGFADRVHWHGVVPDAGELLGAFDVFVMSSRTEGTPIALFEAMAAGVPIVAAAVGGIPDVVSPAEALLVPPRDAAALAAAIRAVHADRVGAQVRARAARDRLVRAYAPEPWLGQYEVVYRQLNPHRDPVQRTR